MATHCREFNFMWLESCNNNHQSQYIARETSITILEIIHLHSNTVEQEAAWQGVIRALLLFYDQFQWSKYPQCPQWKLKAIRTSDPLFSLLSVFELFLRSKCFVLSFPVINMG